MTLHWPWSKAHKHLCRNAWCWTLEPCGCSCYVRVMEAGEVWE